MNSEFPSASHIGNANAPFGRAIVIGGSVAGLMAAAVLSKHFDKVTIVERSSLADGIDFPKGAPQARHPHGLLIRGEQILEDLFPGFRQSLLARGAVLMNVGRDIKMCLAHGWRPQYETGLDAIVASRRLLDHVIYQRMRKNPKVTFLADSEVTTICADTTKQRVIGVQITSRTSGVVEDIPAELVVDASGRSSRAPQWLSQLGYTPPKELSVNAFPGYATRLFEIPEYFNQSWKVLLMAPIPPHASRGAIVLQVEENLWHVALIGMNRDYPPTDEEGYMDFARSLPSQEVYEVIKAAKPVSPIWGYRQAENRMRRFDMLERYLEGFVALGDAVYALNPVYGQGITLVAIAVELLDHCLTEQARPAADAKFSGMAEKFQKRLSKELLIPWQMATNEDMRWSNAIGKQESDTTSKLVGYYIQLALKAMPHSIKITESFTRVQNMISPPSSLMNPDIAFSVIKTHLSFPFIRSSGSSRASG